MRWAIVLIGLLGCGGGDKANRGGAATSDGAEIEVDRESIDFGALDEGTSRTEILAIRNAGSADLHIAATVEGDGAFAVTAAPPAVIAPMASGELAITFQPAADGEADARLVLATDDQDSPRLEIPLSGEGRSPRLVIEPGDPDLGGVYVGCRREEAVAFTNAGSLDLTIDSLAILGDGTFSLAVPDGALLPWTLSPGQSRSATLAFAPLAAGELTSTLVVASNDPTSPTAEAPLAGEGVVYGEIEDSWLLLDKPRVAVLLAVNVGPSMQDHLPSLALSIAAMAEALDASVLDFRIAAVAQDSGEICGDVAYIHSGNAADALAIAEAMLGLAEGAACEAGDDAERAFALLEAGLAANASWITDEAGWSSYPLHLVGVSDAAEQSPGGWESYLAGFQAQRDDPDDVVFHAIGEGPSADCEGAEFYAGLYEAVGATGGAFLSLCPDDWGAVGQELAGEMGARGDFFALSERPVAETLAVSVDLAPQPGERWRYDSAENAVLFAPGYQPASGAVVEVRYALEPDCP